MREEDFVAAQLFLLGEDFGSVAKGKLEAAAALKKIIYLQSSKGKQGFQGGYPGKFSWAPTKLATALGNPRRGPVQSQTKVEND